MTLGDNTKIALSLSLVPSQQTRRAFLAKSMQLQVLDSSWYSQVRYHGVEGTADDTWRTRARVRCLYVFGR